MSRTLFYPTRLASLAFFLLVLLAGAQSLRVQCPQHAHPPNDPPKICVPASQLYPAALMC